MDVEAVANGLPEGCKQLVIKWSNLSGEGHWSTVVADMHLSGLVHIDATKTRGGKFKGYRARLTPLGLEVRAYLEKNAIPYTQGGGN